KVLDFGLARLCDVATDLFQSGSGGLLGTPAYMAPEQAAGTAVLDHRVDIYAAGVLAYELLTGKPPFSGAPQQVLAAQIVAVPSPIEERCPTIPAPLASAISRCLEKDPDSRFASAEELLAVLEVFRGTTSTDLPVPGSARRFSPAVAIAGALALGAAVLALILGSSSSVEMELGAALPLTSEPGLEIDPAISPDGRHVAYVAGPLHRARLHVRQLGGQPVRVAPDTGPPHRFPRWSPDGTQLLFAQGFAVLSVPALSGSPRVHARATDTIISVAWAPDGNTIAFSTRDTVYRLTLDGEPPRAISAAQRPHALDWSPDGRRIALVEGGSRFTVGDVRTFGDLAPSDIAIVSADGGGFQRVSDGRSMNLSPVWMPDGRTLLFVSDRAGPRDVYAVVIGRGGSASAPVRVSAGLNAQSISLSADGSLLVYSHYTNRSNIWVMPTDPRGMSGAADARLLTTGTEVVESLTLSADGRRLYFDSDRAGNSDIYRIDLPTGAAVQLTNDPAREFAPSESQDGKWIAFHSWRYGSRDLFIMPREGGAPRRVTSDSGNEVRPQWSPSGRRLAYLRMASGRSSQVWIERRGDGTWTAPVEVVDRQANLQFLDDSTWLIANDAGGLDKISLMTGTRSTYYAPAQPRQRVSWFRVIGTTLYFRSRHPDGVASYWKVAAPGGIPRLIAEWNDPDRPLHRSAGETDGKYIYFTFADRQSDIFIGDLRRRTR
ncbi:MAG: protein kinase domain-containing protein, partial [Gemmatimonadaceae bacterium]